VKVSKKPTKASISSVKTKATS